MILTSFKRPDHIPLYAEDLVWTHRLVGEFSSNNNHMTLQQQLEYNWERGFYSVVKSSSGCYYIFSTKAGDTAFRFSANFHKDLEQEKKCVGSKLISFGEIEEIAAIHDLKIVDTIHPSELMGKGFQVGDKVEVIFGVNSGRTGTVQGKTYQGTYFLKEFEFDSHYYKTRDLKPVLPVEEQVDMGGKKEKEQVSEQDKLVTSTLNVEFDSGTPQVTLGYEISQRSHICNCGFWNSEKVWGETLYTQQFGDSCKSMSITNNYVVCSKCGERLRRVKVTYLDDIGSDGHIVNL